MRTLINFLKIKIFIKRNIKLDINTNIIVAIDLNWHHHWYYLFMKKAHYNTVNNRKFEPIFR